MSTRPAIESRAGQVTRKEDGFCVRFERLLPFNVDAVWRALTDPDKLKIWFADIDMDFKVGGKMVIHFKDEQKTESIACITRIEPKTLFAFDWEGETAVWELVPKDDYRCILIFTYSGLADEYAVSVPAGWHSLLDQLEVVLEGRTEPYPFGIGETEETKSLKEFYGSIVYKEYPDLKKENA